LWFSSQTLIFCTNCIWHNIGSEFDN
jgi:hypothetical protein